MFLSKGKEKILKLFFKNPHEEIHQRAVSRIAKVPLDNVNKYLRSFMADGILVRRVVSNMTFFKANLENPELLKIFEFFEIERRKQFYNKNRKIARLLREYTDNLVALSKARIQMVVLFGSVARGEWTRKSDVDVLVLSLEKGKDITKVLDKAKIDVSPLLEIVAINTTRDKFIEGFRKKLGFYANLWQDRVVLYNEFMFWQLVKKGAELSG
jgi:predicted nucleotidyltransferase